MFASGQSGLRSRRRYRLLGAPTASCCWAISGQRRTARDAVGVV